MTQDYKSALDSMPVLDEIYQLDDMEYTADWFNDHHHTILSALQLAQEAEQVKRERDELAAYILEVDDCCRTLFGDEAHELAKKVSEEMSELHEERDEFININISELPSFVYIPLPEGRVIGVNQKIQSIASTGDAYKCAEIIYKSYRAKKVRNENGNA